VILNVEQFLKNERPFWDELEAMLLRMEQDALAQWSLEENRRFYYLYRRSASGLAQLTAFSTSPEVYGALEALVARAYAQIHQHRKSTTRFNPRVWVRETFPGAVRRRYKALLVACTITFLGTLFGMVALAIDDEAKAVIMPFSHLLGDPADRVAMEESVALQDGLEMPHATFAATLMVNNIRVSILALSLGIVWGLGTLIVLFYNGIIIGAVTLDYLLAGQGVFLLGWLLPHGSVEIPSILFAGQAGFVLGYAILGHGNPHPLRKRLRDVAPDTVTIMFGVAILLVWAGIVESFFSQYHEPFVPYWAKILFGSVQLAALAFYLSFSGRDTQVETPEP